jgi:hypothetical protein
MSENKDNRWFYKFSEKEIQDYKVKEKNHIKIITRLNPDFPQNIELFRELFPDCKMAKRIRKNDDPENVKNYEWTYTPYDNTGYGDEYNFITFIIIHEENLNELFDIIKNNFKNHTIRKSSNYTYTLKIDPFVSVRGIWKSKRSFTLSTQFPIAILSFGRYNDYGRTHKLLSKLKIPHYLFVEPFEYDFYTELYNPANCILIKAPEDFHLQNMGSTPMRNYILDYFKNLQKERVWMLDDNIKCYKRLYRGVKNPIEDIEIFTTIEDYILHYDNVGLVSHNFNPFVVEGGCRNIMCKNGKCYSSMLIRTDPEIRFKHKHQEDNFISIEYISKGYTNLCFNHICYDKNTSGDDDGGNTKFIYKKDEEDIGRKERFDYSFKTAEKLIKKGIIELKEKKTLNNLIFHKPLKHEFYHIEFNYNMLENYDKNDIIKNQQSKIAYIDTLYLDTGDELDPREELMKLSKEELIDLILKKIDLKEK